MSEQLLLDCGFAQEEARSELYALAKGNLDHILTQGCVQSLTGPLERNGATVEKHISALNEKQRKIYTSCAEYLTDLAQSKHPDRDYTEMRKLCRDGNTARARNARKQCKQENTVYAPGAQEKWRET